MLQKIQKLIRMLRNSPILKVQKYVKELELHAEDQDENIEINDLMVEILTKNSADYATEAKQARALAANINKAFT